MTLPAAFFLPLRRCHTETTAANIMVAFVATPVIPQNTGAEPGQAVSASPWRLCVPVAKWMAIQAAKGLCRIRVPGWLPYAIDEKAAAWLEARMAPRPHFSVHLGQRVTKTWKTYAYFFRPRLGPYLHHGDCGSSVRELWIYEVWLGISQFPAVLVP